MAQCLHQFNAAALYQFMKVDPVAYFEYTKELEEECKRSRRRMEKPE